MPIFKKLLHMVWSFTNPGRSPFCFALFTTNLLNGAFKMYGQEMQQSISDALADESEAPGDQGHPKELIPFINKAGTSVAWGPVVQPKCQLGWPLKWGQSFTASAAEFSIMSLCRMSQNLPSSTAFLPCPLVFLLLCSLHCCVPAAAPSLFQVAWSVTGQARSVCVCVGGGGRTKKPAQTPTFVKLMIPKKC